MNELYIFFFSGKFDKDSFISPTMDEQKNIKQKKNML